VSHRQAKMARVQATLMFHGGGGGGVEMELGVWTLALCARMYPGTGQHQNQCAHWVTPLLKNYTPFWIIYGFNDFPPH
jgi:hypothetical protein